MAEADAKGAQGLPSIRRAALRGSAIVMGAYGGREFIRLAANLVVSRLLSPEAYGLMAIVNTLIGLFTEEPKMSYDPSPKVQALQQRLRVGLRPARPPRGFKRSGRATFA